VNASPLDLFLAACGSDEPLRVGVGLRDEMQEEAWMFRQPFLLIGRRPDSDLVIDHWQVSRRHAYLQMIDGEFFCVDLGSRTGTHGGDPSERSGWLEEGRALQIGPYAVRLEWPARRARSADALPGVTWELPGRALGQALWRMDRNLVLVGRSPTCRIRIVEPDVSKYHCSLVLTRLGVWAVDLLGQKGLLVNGEPIRCARLEDGDELRVGRHAIRPRYDTPPPPLETVRIEPALAINDGAATVIRPAPPKGPTADLPTRFFPRPSVPAWPAAPASSPSQSSSHELAPQAGNPGILADPGVSMMFQQFGMMQQQMFDQFHQTMLMMFEGFAALHRESAASIREEFEEVRRLSREIEELRAETAKLAEAAAKANERPRPVPNGFGPAGGGDRRPNPALPQYAPIKKPTSTTPEPEGGIHAQLCLRLTSIENERQNRWQKILGMMNGKG